MKKFIVTTLFIGAAIMGAPELVQAVNHTAPKITSISPSSTLALGEEFSMSVTGTGFTQNSIVEFGVFSYDDRGYPTGYSFTPRATTFAGVTKLGARIFASDLTASGEFMIRVNNGSGKISNQVAFTVQELPAPVIRSIEPSIIAENKFYYILINGSNFIEEGYGASQIEIAGYSYRPNSATATSLYLSIPNTVTLSPGIHKVRVINPSPGGGPSNEVDLNIKELPIITSLSVNSTERRADPNGPSLTMTIMGNNLTFVDRVFLTHLSNGRSTSISIPTQGLANQVTITIPAVSLTTAGNFELSVQSNREGGYGSSNEVAFTVTGTNPAPTITAISPPFANASSNYVTVLITGTNFTPYTSTYGSVYVGNPTYVSPTELRIGITALTTTTTIETRLTINLYNPPPGGGDASAIFIFRASNDLTPIITEISPSTKALPHAEFSLYVTGRNFKNSSRIKIGNETLDTTFLSPTELRAVVPPLFLAVSGSYNVTVVNPSPVWRASNAVVLTAGGNNPLLNPPPIQNPVNTSTFLTRRLGMGDTGDDVKTLQQDLIALGYPLPVGATGYFGLQTQSAVSKFQLDNGLSTASLSLGKVGPWTVARLNEKLESVATSPVSVPVESPVVTPPPGAPVISSVSPTYALITDPPVTLLVNGSNFTATGKILIDGVTRPTTYNSANQVETTQSPESSLGLHTIGYMHYVGEGAVYANIVTFTVYNPIPRPTSISPSSASAGSSALTVTMNGTNFVPGSAVHVNGFARATEFFSVTQLRVLIPATDMVAQGTLNITVVNPATAYIPQTVTALPFTVTATTPTPEPTPSPEPASAPTTYNADQQKMKILAALIEKMKELLGLLNNQ